jgi:hypothetical protein
MPELIWDGNTIPLVVWHRRYASRFRSRKSHGYCPVEWSLRSCTAVRSR